MNTTTTTTQNATPASHHVPLEARWNASPDCANAMNASAAPTRRPLSVVFEDIEYVVNHGGKPRGRGSWAFSERRHPDVLTKVQVLWSPSMTFGEAKRWAKVQLVSMGVSGLVVLYVQP